MFYGAGARVLFIARIERIVTATQNNDLIVIAATVRLSNAPPPITWTPNITKTRIVETATNSDAWTAQRLRSRSPTPATM